MTEYEVEFILQARVAQAQNTKHKEWKYLVKWVGYGMEHNTWEPETNFHMFSGDMIDQFWAKVDLKGRDRDISQFKVGEEIFPTMRPPRKTKHKILEQPVTVQPLRKSLPLVATDHQHLSSSLDIVGTALAPLPSLETLAKNIKAVSRYPSNPLLNNAIAFLDNKPNLERFIRLTHNADPESINQPDMNGMAPLYVAVTNDSLTAVRVLLDLGVDLTPLRSRDVADRVAPLVLLQEKMARDRRTPNTFMGYLFYDGTPLADKEEIERIVKEAMGDYPAPDCSCGACDEGWLSAKMRARLQAAASNISRHMLMQIASFPARPRQSLTAEQCEHDLYMRYIPLSSWTSAFLTFYRGYEQIVDIIHDVLARKIAFSIPASEPIRMYIKTLPGSHYLSQKSDAQFFLDKGSHVDHVLDCVVDFAEKAAGEEDKVWMEQVADMPHCSHDSNFDLVRRKLGFWGNY